MNHEGTKDTKRKGKPAMKRWRLFRWIAGFLVTAMFVIIVLAVLGPIINGQIRNRSLATELVPTATALLKSLPSLFVESENLTLELGQRSFDEICVVLINDSNTSAEIQEQYGHSRLFVNDAWVIGAINYQGLRLGLPSELWWCGWGELAAGIHLIEFELRDSVFGEPIYRHQWAIEIGSE